VPAAADPHGAVPPVPAQRNACPNGPWEDFRLHLQCHGLHFKHGLYFRAMHTPIHSISDDAIDASLSVRLALSLNRWLPVEQIVGLIVKALASKFFFNQPGLPLAFLCQLRLVLHVHTAH